MKTWAWIVLVGLIGAIISIVMFVPLIIIGKILVAIAVVSFLVFLEFSDEKDEYDDLGETAKFDTGVWFDKHWDNLIVWVLAAGICAALSNEISMPLINKFAPEFTNYSGTITYTSVAISAFAGFKLSQFLKKKKK